MDAAPRQVWCWGLTYLPAQVAGRWFYLYLIMDEWHLLRPLRPSVEDDIGASE